MSRIASLHSVASPAPGSAISATSSALRTWAAELEASVAVPRHDNGSRTPLGKLAQGTIADMGNFPTQLVVCWTT